MADYDYPVIRAWGKMLASLAPYVKAQLERARAMNAPQDATFLPSDSKQWSTLREVSNIETLRTLPHCTNDPRVREWCRKRTAALLEAKETE